MQILISPFWKDAKQAPRTISRGLLLSCSGGVTTARHSAGKQPHSRSC
nr:MAG TPA: hypothetical protein [Caudoviricetes sp.]